MPRPRDAESRYPTLLPAGPASRRYDIVWRIPLLFLISGMGVRFAMERRDWKQLLKDRTLRIGVPYLFGIMIYLKDNPDNPVFRFLRGVIRRPGGLLLLTLPVVIEAQLVNPTYFSSYVDTLHGWLIGLVCFCLGLMFASVHDVFWPAVTRLRRVTLVIAAGAFLVRWRVFDLQDRCNGLTGLESMCGMLAILGFGAVHLNRPSRALGVLSWAVYPVYIVHLPVQFAIAYFLLPRDMSAPMKLGLMVLGTFGTSYLIYEFLLSRSPRDPHSRSPRAYCCPANPRPPNPR